MDLTYHVDNNNKGGEPMVENMKTTQVPNGSFGEIEVAPEVLEVIAGIAANEVEGVYAMQGKLSSGVQELFGRVDHTKGVHLTSDDDGLKVDVFCYLKYGAQVPKVAAEIQKGIKEQIEHMTDIKLSEVNIHVAGIIPEKSALENIVDFGTEEEDERF